MKIFSISFIVTENVPPAQLKKLLNKQRKARRKAELEKAQAVAAQEKREHKNKQVPANSEENEFQSQDELIPEKLERVSISRRLRKYMSTRFENISLNFNK